MILKFTHNWNNKLRCKAFTTLRIRAKKQGCLYDVELNGKHMGKAVCVKIKALYLSQINDFIGYLDTGYSAEECKDVLQKMYKNKGVNFNRQKIYLHLFKYEEQHLFIKNEEEHLLNEKANE